MPRWTGLHGHDRPTRLCWRGAGTLRAPPTGLSKNCVWAPVGAVSTSHKAFRSCGIFAQTSHEVAGLWDRLWDPVHIRRRIRLLTATISGQGSHKHPTIVPQTACYNSPMTVGRYWKSGCTYLLQPFSQESLTTPQRLIRSTFGFVARREFWENGCILQQWRCGIFGRTAVAGLYRRFVKSWRHPSQANRCLGQSNAEERLFFKPGLSTFWRNDDIYL